MFKNSTAVDVALMVGKVVGRGMNEEEFMDITVVPKLRHHFFPSSKCFLSRPPRSNRRSST
jgi:hypothetical protein